MSAFFLASGPAAAGRRPLALRLPHGDDEETRDKEGKRRLFQVLPTCGVIGPL